MEARASRIVRVTIKASSYGFNSTLDALKAAGVASLTLGHPSKNGNGSARGAGAQEDAGDVNLSLTMHQGEVTDPEGVVVLRVIKNRPLGLSVPPLFLKPVECPFKFL